MTKTLNLGHLEIESPWANAGGVIKGIGELNVIARTGVGWIEAGSYTLEKRVGLSPNGEVVYVHDPETGETWNSLSMPNKGMDDVEKDIPEMKEIANKHGKPLIINVAPVSNDPVNESVELIARTYEAGADAVLLNGGCPTVLREDGSREEILSRNPEILFKTLRALRPLIDKYNKIFLRVSPIEEDNMLEKICLAINLSGVVSVVFTPNSWPGNKPPDHLPQLEVKGGVGGLSGPYTAKKSLIQTLGHALKGDYQVVSSSGITTAQELYTRLDFSHATKNIVAGAGTTFFHESGDWKHDVDKLLFDYSDLRENNR